MQLQINDFDETLYRTQIDEEQVKDINRMVADAECEWELVKLYFENKVTETFIIAQCRNKVMDNVKEAENYTYCPFCGRRKSKQYKVTESGMPNE